MAPEPRDLVVVGASAGGVEALRTFTAHLPADLPSAIAVVLHIPAGGSSALPAILDRSGPLPAVTAYDGQPFRRGQVHVAPPDHHLLVDGDVLRLSRGPTENGHRPAADTLFRSAAHSRGPRTIGVVLSGALDDGTAGMIAIKSRRGLTVVQDPAEALYQGMPDSVLRHIVADHVVGAAAMGPLLAWYSTELVETAGTPAPSDVMTMEVDVAAQDNGASGEQVLDAGVASGFSCPDCNGTLAELGRPGISYRCRVGHAWSAEALLDAYGTNMERALWTAVRTLEEKVSLARRMRDSSLAHGRELIARRYERAEQESAGAADVLRAHLMHADPKARAGR